MIFIVLFLALIIPEVIVLLNSYPIGLPIAKTSSPILIESESPKVQYCKFSTLIFTIDKSKSLSLHTTVPLYVFSSTVIKHVLYFSPVTWLLLKIYPFSLTIIPVPSPKLSLVTLFKIDPPVVVSFEIPTAYPVA